MIALIIESWIWYGFTIAIAIARFVSRTLTFGSVKKLQSDDWLMLVALCTYTTFMVTINIVADHSSNLLLPGQDVAKMSPEERAGRVYGSKLILVVEQCQIATIWLVKAGLLIMYYRLTIAMRENWFVKGLAVYTAFGFVFMEIFYLGVWCRPFSNYFALPTPNKQCNAATNHLITNAVFNLSTDFAMLVLALQMFVRSRLPLQRKLILCGIFGLGTFVILAAVLNKFYSFTEPVGQQWTYWYVRESSTALLVGNLPFTWTLLRRIFKLRAFDPARSTTGSRRGSISRHRSTRLTNGNVVDSNGSGQGLNDIEAQKQKEHDPYPLSPPSHGRDPYPLSPPLTNGRDPYPLSPPLSDVTSDHHTPLSPGFARNYSESHGHSRSRSSGRRISFNLDLQGTSPQRSPIMTHDRLTRPTEAKPSGTSSDSEMGPDEMQLNDLGGLAGPTTPRSPLERP